MKTQKDFNWKRKEFQPLRKGNEEGEILKREG